MSSFFAKPEDGAKPAEPPAVKPVEPTPAPPVPAKAPPKTEPAKPAEDLLSELSKPSPGPEKPEAPEAPASPTPTGGQLRQKLEETLAENKRLQERMVELEGGAESAKEADALKQKAQQLEERLRVVSYRDSDEYKTKHEKPIETAIAKAAKVAARLKLESGEGMGKPTHVAELHSLLARDDDAKAVERATELFGEAGARILDAVQDIVDAEQSAGEALQNWQKESVERSQREVAEVRKTIDTRLKQFRQNVSDFQEQRPELFEFDDTQAEAFKKYSDIADAAFTGDGRRPEELIPVQALVRNMAAAFVPTRLQLQAAKARIAELETHVQQLSGASPQVNPTAVQPAPTKASSSKEALRAALHAG